MKRQIFLKNYKGFKEQIIELEDVNFLVGENSTGKTSFLNLINILSSQEFWFNYQFNNSEIELGYFEEILSKNATEKTFQIGTERIEVDNKKERVIRILFQFKSDKSLPKIDFIRFAINELNVHVQPNLKKLTCNYHTEKLKTFNDWLYNDKKIKKKSIEIEIPGFRFPLPILFQVIGGAIKKEIGDTQEDLDFGDGIFFRRYTWLAPIRAKAKRIYESYNIKFSPEGEHIPSLLKNLLSQTNKKKNTIDILEKFGKESNLFDTIEINELGDKGISPFEIIIKYNDTPIKLTNVGYGVSQILPLIVEMLSTKRTTFSIQQPEVHLHPKAQAAFGSFLYKACINEEHTFLIETHSDFTINRFRHSLNKSQSTKKELSSQVLFFERTIDGNRVSKISISKNGNYETELPDSYRNFFIDEELKLLEL